MNLNFFDLPKMEIQDLEEGDVFIYQIPAKRGGEVEIHLLIDEGEYFQSHCLSTMENDVGWGKETSVRRIGELEDTEELFNF